MEENSYVSPATVDPVNDLPIGNAEVIRRKHLKHEASIKSIGMLWALLCSVASG